MSFRENLRNRDFVLFWLAQLISQFGDRINQMALVGLIAGRQFGSALELAKLLAFTIIPVFIVGPIAGVYVDRWDRKTTLFVCDIIRGLIVLLIPLVFMDRASMWPIYTVVFLVFCLSRFYVPAKMSIIPELVDPEHLHAANSLATVTGMIAFVAGALLGGLIVEYGGARGGFICDAFTFFVSAFLVSLIARPRLRLRPRELMREGRDMASTYRNVVHEAFAGVRYIAANREIRYIIQLMMVLFMAAGAIYVVIIVFVQDSFGSKTKDLGFLAVALGVGLFLGSLAYGKWGDKKKHVETIFACLIAGGAFMAVFAILVDAWRNLWVALGLALVLGCVVGPIVIAANTVVHKVASQEMQGKVFAAMEFAIHAAFLLTMLLSAKLSEVVSRSWILATVGLLFSLCGIVGLYRYSRRIAA